jgi:hypothetical protein
MRFWQQIRAHATLRARYAQIKARAIYRQIYETE